MTDPQPVDKLFVPAACPVCRSTDVHTTSKVVCEATYWRCGGCGEIWNLGRRKEPARRPTWR